MFHFFRILDLSYNDLVSLRNTSFKLNRLVKLSLKKNKLEDLRGKITKNEKIYSKNFKFPSKHLIGRFD